MNLRPILLSALLLCAGCQYSDMREAWDVAADLEKQGRKAVRTERYAEAAELYSRSAVKYEEAFDIAKERQSAVLVSHLGAELSIVFAARADCVRPDNNSAGSWQQAYELYATSGMWAAEVTMLKLQRNAKHNQAFCVRPDNNPEGSWEKAAGLYAKGVELADQYSKPKDRAEGMREWALCLLEGDRSKVGENAEARKLLIKARKLEDEEAAEILAADESTYCSACGNELTPGAKFCPDCGQDQTAKPAEKGPPPPENKRPAHQQRKAGEPRGAGPSR